MTRQVVVGMRGCLVLSLAACQHRPRRRWPLEPVSFSASGAGLFFQKREPLRR